MCTARRCSTRCASTPCAAALAKPGDRLAVRVSERIVVRHHFKSITEQQNKLAAEGGKEPAHHLFCEFFDNSIESLLRTRCARPDAGRQLPPPIELHLVYSNDPNHRGAGAHRRARLRQCLNEQELKGWAEPNKRMDERRVTPRRGGAERGGAARAAVPRRRQAR